MYKIISLDREITHRKWRENLDVIRGGIIPRMYERQLLLKAYENIPVNSRDKLNAFEDSVIYYEVSKLYKCKYTVHPKRGLPHRGRLPPFTS